MDAEIAIKKIITKRNHFHQKFNNINRLALHKKIKNGFSYKTVPIIKKALTINAKKIAELLCVTLPTVLKRKSAGKLNAKESDRLVQVALVIGGTRTVIKNKPIQWLKDKQVGLDNKVPLNLIKTKAGCRLVEAELESLHKALPL